MRGLAEPSIVPSGGDTTRAVEPARRPPSDSPAGADGYSRGLAASKTCPLVGHAQFPAVRQGTAVERDETPRRLPPKRPHPLARLTSGKKKTHR
jgi:hypothetical protein